MASNIIVGSSDGDQLDEMTNGAQKIAESLTPRVEVSVKFATSIDDVVRKRSPETILLIISTSLPQSRSSSVTEDEPALEFIKSLRAEPQAPPCIVVSDLSKHLRPISRIKGCELLFLDGSTDYVEDCLQLARKLGVVREESSPASPDPGSPISLAVAMQLPADTTGGDVPVVTPVLTSGVTPALVPAVTPAFVPVARAANSKYALIEVDLPADLNLAMVRLEGHDGGEVWRGPSEGLRLKKSKVEDLVNDCKNLKKNLPNWQAKKPERYYELWRKEYKELGERFGHLLWNTKSFNDLYNQGIGFGDGNVRVRFNLEQPWFDGLWEAIPTSKGERFLMLENTIARRVLDEGNRRLALFSSDSGSIASRAGALRILVIKSNVEPDSIPHNANDPKWTEYWTRYGRPLQKLGHLDDEVAELRALAAVAAEPLQIEVKVDELPATDRPPGTVWSLADDVRNLLEAPSQSYDIVHFAGHSFFAEDPKGKGRGYLVFSSHPRPQAIPVATVATWLAKADVQLIYLSCCRSSAASAAVEFARNKIPMAIGFHWDVDDRKAPVFAKEFYKELLKSRLKVCPAVNQARINLFNGSHGDDPIWASPVFIAQPLNWIQVEAVLRSSGPASLVQQAA
jgi:hypothetical protein